MSRTGELTTTITLTVEDGPTFDAVRRDVGRRLRAAFGTALIVAAEAIRLVAVHDPAGMRTRPPDLRALLSCFGAVARVWTVGDVLDRQPDLTPAQATAVWPQVLDTHGARRNLGGDDFARVAADLFGVAPVTRDTLGENA